MNALRKLMVGALGLTLTAAVPAFAKADVRDSRGRVDARDARDARDRRGANQSHVEVRRDDQRQDNWRDRDGHGDRDQHFDNDRFDHDRGRVIVEHPVVVERPVVIAPPALMIVTTPACQPDADVNVAAYDIPDNIMDTARRESPGDITSIQFVRRDGHEFYRFMVSEHGARFDLRVATNGHLLGIDRV